MSAAPDTPPTSQTSPGPTSAALPELDGLRRPRWRPEVPALWRDRTTLQLGDDVVIDRVTPAHVAWLAGLDGSQTDRQVQDRLPLAVDEARRLLRSLLAAGALEDASRLPDSVRWAPQAERATVLRRFGAALHAARDLDSAYAAMAGRDRVRAHVVGVGDLADALVPALAAAGLLTTKDPGEATVVLLADSHHPDVPAHFDHDTHDLPHLHVGARSSWAVAGPMVVPGRTSCLRCAHLHLRDSDAAWPLLAVQWSQAVPASDTVDPLMAHCAAVHAALLLRAWADAPEDPSDWAERAAVLRPDGSVEWVGRPRHPLCGCCWPSA